MVVANTNLQLPFLWPRPRCLSPRARCICGLLTVRGRSVDSAQRMQAVSLINGVLLIILLTSRVLSAPSESVANPDGPAVFVYTAEHSPSLQKLLSCKTKEHDFLPRHYSGQWGTDIKIHQWLASSVHRTTEPEKAVFFFVPSYAKCLNDHNVLGIHDINETLSGVLDELPYFKCASCGARTSIGHAL